MSTIPDDHQPHHDTPPADPAAITLTSLRAEFPDWEILVHLDSSIVSAEHRSADGRTTIYLVAFTLAELAAKLATAAAKLETAGTAGA